MSERSSVLNCTLGDSSVCRPIKTDNDTNDEIWIDEGKKRPCISFENFTSAYRKDSNSNRNA